MWGWWLLGYILTWFAVGSFGPPSAFLWYRRGVCKVCYGRDFGDQLKVYFRAGWEAARRVFAPNEPYADPPDVLPDMPPLTMFLSLVRLAFFWPPVYWIAVGLVAKHACKARETARNCTCAVVAGEIDAEFESEPESEV